MKKYILSLMMGLCLSVSSFAQSHSEYPLVQEPYIREAWMPPSHGNMKHATTTLGSTSSTVTSNGMNVHHADTSALSRFETTTEHGELALPTNPVWQEAGTTTETSELAQVLAVTQTSLSVACMSVTNIILPYVMGGDCLFKPNVISLFPSEKTCFAQASW